MEEGQVTISRASSSVTYPANFMLVAAMNPCPCGFLGDPKRECSCTYLQIQRYRSKISGPLLDRIDIHMEVPPVQFKELAGNESGETSAAMLRRVTGGKRNPGGAFPENETSHQCRHEQPADQEILRSLIPIPTISWKERWRNSV
jgi:magnesium chelatase family protein